MKTNVRGILRLGTGYYFLQFQHHNYQVSDNYDSLPNFTNISVKQLMVYIIIIVIFFIVRYTIAWINRICWWDS